MSGTQVKDEMLAEMLVETRNREYISLYISHYFMGMKTTWRQDLQGQDPSKQEVQIIKPNSVH